MTEENIKDRYQGLKFTIIHCNEALDSYQKALSRVEARRRKSFTQRMIQQIKRLADGNRMSKENFPQEGDLPKTHNRQKPKKFNALKRIPIRGYCWKSEKHKNTYFISHYVYKNYDKLDEKDTKKVGDNWKRIEENNDER